MEDLIENEDYCWEDGLMVFTRRFLLERGSCCGSGCRHCPYEPRWSRGTTTVSTDQTQPAADQ